MTLGVIFDMDGVLVDSAPAHLESWQRLAARHGLEVTPERFRETFGRPSRDIIRLLWGPGTSDRQIAKLDAEKEQIYRGVISAHVPLMPGCRATLRTLHESGFKLAVATSGPPENIEVVLSEGLIANYFTARVDGFEVFRGKPAPDCFRLAAERLELPPERCVVVEDAPVGIAAGRAAGMPVIGLVGTHPAETLRTAGATAVVTELSQITPDYVRSLVAG